MDQRGKGLSAVFAFLPDPLEAVFVDVVDFTVCLLEVLQVQITT